MAVMAPSPPLTPSPTPYGPINGYRNTGKSLYLYLFKGKILEF